MQAARWERKDGRYYIADVEQDLLGDWIVVRAWGGKLNKGRLSRTPVSTLEEGREALLEIEQRRLKHGYTRNDY